MKKTMNYVVSSALLLMSYAAHSDISPEYRLDTSNSIKSKIVIFISPTTKEIKKIKAKSDDLESFYVAADDLNYYIYKAEEYLDKLHIPYKYTHDKKIKFLVNNKETVIDYSKSDETWYILIYNGKDTPTKTYAIDIDSHGELLKQLVKPPSTSSP